MSAVIRAYRGSFFKTGVGLLNKVINEAYALNPPQTIRNKRLIEKGISINAQNKDGNTALHLAYYLKLIKIICIIFIYIL